MRLDGVEIKVTLAGEQTPAAVQALHLPAEERPWRIYFCEDVTAGVSPGTPLLDLGVVLRAREKPGGKDDTTIKLRPCRRSQLTDDWLAAEEGESGSGVDWEFKVEADWAGERRVLAASCSADLKGGVQHAGGGGRRPVEELFLAEQIAFLRECAGADVNLRTLTVLPPVSATRWKEVPAAPPHLEARAERWTVDELDFLELSVVADLEDAAAKQAALTRFVRDLDLAVDEKAESKTRQVLDHLVGQLREPR
jgi:hypothetical protein